MAATTADRRTMERDGNIQTLGVKAATLIPAGVIVSKDTSGRAVNGTATVDDVVLGVSREIADNSGGADNAIKATIQKGVFCFANSPAGDLIVAADIGLNCYVVDNQTVAKTSATNTRPVAGKVFDVGAEGVWVEFI